MADNIILCGFMGTGKSTIGRLVAQQLGWRFVDTDQLIEAQQCRSISTIFVTDGEAAFRALERRVCEQIGAWQQTVVATGGGMPVDPINRTKLIEGGLAICLTASVDLLYERLSRAEDRPLLRDPNPRQRIEELLAARAEAYNALPYQIDVTTKTPFATADTIISIWRRIRTK